MQRLEHALRGLDKALEDEQAALARAEKTLSDLLEQSGRRFEHEARLKDLIRRQEELYTALDLEKSEQQVAAPADGQSGFEGHGCKAKMGRRTAPSRWSKHRNDARHEWQEDDNYHGDRYREMFAPSVTASLLKRTDLAGYRDGQVYIRRSMHVPLNFEAVRDVMTVF